MIVVILNSYQKSDPSSRSLYQGRKVHLRPSDYGVTEMFLNLPSVTLAKDGAQGGTRTPTPRGT